MLEYVKMVNVGTKPFDFHQNNQRRVIQPGADTIVPWGLVVTLFGHPNVPNTPPRNERDKLYAKIRGRFNFQLGFMTEDDWEAIRPKVEFYDVESGNRIYTVFDDPYMEHGRQELMREEPTTMDALNARIAELTNLVNTLVTERVAQASAPAQGGTQSPTPTTDSPNEDFVGLLGDQGGGLSITMPAAVIDASEDTPQAVGVGDTGSDRPKLAPRPA